MAFDYTDLQLKRTYQLVIGTPNSGKGLEINGDEDAGEGLQLTFDIKKNIDNKEQGNTCSISLYNLSEDSIKYIQKDSMAVVLRVGYKGIGNKTLFQGMVSEIDTDDRSSRGGDRKTTLQCVPADSLTYRPNISKTFPANSTPRQVFQYVIGQSETITRASFNSDVIDEPFAFGYSVEGNAKTIISQLARDIDVQYRLDGKRLYVNDPNKYQSPNSAKRAFQLTPSNGLLGTPSFASADGKSTKGDKNKKNGVKFTSLINPLIQPGSAVSLKGSTIEGIFKVNSVSYKGDWRGSKWEAVCHCSKLKGREV